MKQVMTRRGLTFYSKYLDSECTVVFYLTNKHWWFKSEEHSKIMKAGTPFDYFFKVVKK